MDLPKFVWMLENSALYFPRADLLGDSYEGAIPYGDIELRRKEEQDDLSEGRTVKWAPGLSGPEDLGRLMVRSTYVSCWNLSDVENAGLWSLYGGGVAVRSTVESLKESLKCDEPVYIGMVDYIDYRTDRIARGSTLAPLVHKRKHFEHEKELRAVISGETIERRGADWRWLLEDPRKGITADVDLMHLVDEVRIAPSDPVLGEVVPLLVRRFSLDVPVEQSSLDDPPQF